MAITGRASNGYRFSLTQETSGSAPTYLFSPHGPHIANRQPATSLLKSDVADAGESTVDGIGKVWTLSDCSSNSPSAIYFRTQLPGECDEGWSISLETHFGHASNQAKNSNFAAFAVAGRIISGMSASSGKAPNLSGSWTSTAVNFTSNNGGSKQTGWYPYGKVADNSGHYAIPVPPQPLEYTMERSRFILLRDFVNEADAGDPESFEQGSLLDLCLIRDLDPTRAHNGDPGTPLGATDIRVHSVKVIYNQYTGSG